MDVPQIVLATDLSVGSESAARWAHAVGSALDAQVTVAHVIEIGLKSWLGSRYDVLVDEEKRQAAEAKVTTWYRAATGADPAQIDLRVNSCFNALTEAVAEHDADLLVMAPTSKSALAQIVVGSRVQEMASRPPCSLVVAASGELPRAIGVATDFSASAGLAVSAAGDLAARLGADLHLLHVAEVPDLPAFEEDLFAGSFESFYAEAMSSLEDQAGTHLAGHAEPTLAVLQGRAEAALADYAKTHGLDMLVMGQTGHDSVLGDMLGSVPRGLINQLPCSVLVVPAKTSAID